MVKSQKRVLLLLITIKKLFPICLLCHSSCIIKSTNAAADDLIQVRAVSEKRGQILCKKLRPNAVLSPWARDQSIWGVGLVSSPQFEGVFISGLISFPSFAFGLVRTRFVNPFFIIIISAAAGGRLLGLLLFLSAIGMFFPGCGDVFF